MYPLDRFQKGYSLNFKMLGATTFCQLGILSTRHFVNSTFCQLAILSTRHFVKSAFCQLAILSTQHFVNLTFCQIGILSNRHFFNSVFCHQMFKGLIDIKDVGCWQRVAMVLSMMTLRRMKVFFLVFNEDSKMGSAIFVPFVS